MKRDARLSTCPLRISADEQLRHLGVDRVHLGRKRAIHTRYQVELPEALVDLVALIEELPLSEEEYNRIEHEFIHDFEPRYVAALGGLGSAVGADF